MEGEKGFAEAGCCSHKSKERTGKEYQDLIHRLNRIEGQVRGIKGMVEKDDMRGEGYSGRERRNLG